MRVLVFSLFFAAFVASSAANSTLHEFSFRLSGEPETLDWNLAHTNIEVYLMNNLMEGLVTFDQKLHIVPALAKSWKKSKDGKTYTFTIRENVKWSDGVPLRAQDFEYSWKRLLSPGTAAAYSYLLYDIEGAEDYNKGVHADFKKVGIKAIDDHTFEVNLRNPVAHWILLPTFWVTYPLRKDLIDKYGNSWTQPGKLPSLGPFVLSSHEHENKIVMTRNPNYWGPRGNLERVTAYIIRDDSTALNLYKTGKIDFLSDISTAELHAFSGNPELKKFNYLKTGYIGFVQSKYPLDQVKFRKAISMAIDRTKIDKILHGGQQPATTFVPPPLFSYSSSIGLKFDPVAAKKELKASGWKMDSKSKPIELVCSNFDRSLVLSQFIQSELKKNLGVEIAIRPFDHKTFRAQMDLKLFPMFLVTWGADYPDPDNFLSVFMGSSGNNRTYWKSDAYDSLVMRARASDREKSRKADYQKAEKILLEENAVILPLYYEPNLALIKSRVKNFQINELNYVFLRGVSVD